MFNTFPTKTAREIHVVIS